MFLNTYVLQKNNSDKDYVTVNCLYMEDIHMVFRKIEKIIVADGWNLIRINGSHYLYKKAGCDSVLVISNHNGKDLSIGVVKNLEKMTGLSLLRAKEFFHGEIY